MVGVVVARSGFFISVIVVVIDVVVNAVFIAVGIIGDVVRSVPSFASQSSSFLGFGCEVSFVPLERSQGYGRSEKCVRVRHDTI